ELGRPLLVCFGLTEAFPEANLRHYTFMLEGLREVGLALQRRGIAFTMQRGNPAEVALRLGRRASMIVCDRGYLALQKAWRQNLARRARCAVVQVESDVVVPVNAASDKAEFAARTLRPKSQRLWPKYLREVRTVPVMVPGLSRVPPGLDWRNPETILRRLKIDSRNRSELIAPFRQPRNISRAGTREAENVFHR
ncbi:MAG: deoxyribodipyrimidine photolyase, partial [Chloroflexota bacterium]